MVYTRPRSHGEWDAQTPQGFWDTNGSPNPHQTTRPYNNQKKKKKKKKEKKETGRFVDFAVPVDHRVKLKEGQKKNQYQDLPKEMKKTVEPESDVYINCDWCSWFCHQRIGTGIGGLTNKRTSGDYPKYGIAEIR